jgi:hypothetical protein
MNRLSGTIDVTDPTTKEFLSAPGGTARRDMTLAAYAQSRRAGDVAAQTGVVAEED